MAKIEVEEGDLLASNRVVQAFQTMLGNPKSRELLLKAQKTANPNAVIPEIDARAPVEAALGEIHKTLADIKKEREDEKAAAEAEKKTREFQASWDAQKAALRARGYTDEGIAKIEEHAAKEGIPNLRAAAADFDRLNPPATPVSVSGGDVLSYIQSPPEDDAPMKALFESKGEDTVALDQLVQSTLRDVRSNAPQRR